MKKKSLLLIFSLLFLNFVSAYPATIQNLLDELDPSTAILGSMFIIFFILINYALSKAFKGQKGIAGILAFVVSFLAIYTINRSGFDYYNIYYNIFSGIGLSSRVASTFLPLILLAIAIFIVWRTNFATLSLIFGVFITFYGAFFAYEKVVTIFLGILISAISLWFLKKNKKPKNQITINH